MKATGNDLTTDCNDSLNKFYKNTPDSLITTACCYELSATEDWTPKTTTEK